MALVLFESLQTSMEDRKTFFAPSFDSILQTRRPDEISDVLEQTARAVEAGYYAFGFLSYEAGFSFLPGMPDSQQHPDVPLVWFALTRNPQVLSPGVLPDLFREGLSAEVANLRLSKTPEEYRKSIELIRASIEAGDTYQVNFTMRYRGDFTGSPRALYADLRRKQPVPYAAFIETDDWAIVSLSPELFFRRTGNQILVRPMKGTAPRGRTLQEDRIHAETLRDSLKERAENLMIVDLLRSDLGRICSVGSVRVTGAMEIERYETLLQMTSTIVGDLRDGITASELFRAMFPSGSVTGAPKIRTMQIIDRLEREPRGIYTGAIGFFSPEETVFNVAIRTAFVKGDAIEMGVGSGILHEADAGREYAECELKAHFLTRPFVEFQLIETILWTPEEGFRNLAYHLERLSDSAEYFSFAVSQEKIKSMLIELEQKWDESSPQRIRLLLKRDGSFRLKHDTVQVLREPVNIRFARTRVESTDRFLYHKTTNRKLYDEELKRAQSAGCFDVIFRNESNQITEGAISNLFLRKDDSYLTPPVSAGLLNGTYRRYLMEHGNLPVEERILFEKDLLSADEILLTNAVRGVIRARLVREEND